MKIEPMEGQVSIFDLVSPSGRTCPEPLAVTKARTSGQSLKRSRPSVKTTYQFLDLRNGIPGGVSWDTAGALPGGCTTLNTGECPSDARESTLSQILEANAPEKYYLSSKACAGILRRAERRGKELPPMLKEALMEVVALDA